MKNITISFPLNKYSNKNHYDINMKIKRKDKKSNKQKYFSFQKKKIK